MEFGSDGVRQLILGWARAWREMPTMRCFTMSALVLSCWAVGGCSEQNRVDLYLLGQLGGPVQAIAVSGRYTYLGVGARLIVLDISDPAHPREVGGTTPWNDGVKGVAITGRLAFVAAGRAGLRIVDVSDPSRPTEIGHWEAPGQAEGVAIAEGIVLLAAGPYGLRILDARNPTRLVEIGSAYVNHYAFAVATSGKLACVAAGGAGLLIAEISDPRRPVERGVFDTPGYAWGVEASAEIAFVADAWEGVTAVSLENPAQPRVIATRKLTGWARAVKLTGRRLLVAAARAGLRYLDADTLHEIGAHAAPGGDAVGVATTGDVALVADRALGLLAIHLAQPTQPVLLQTYSPLGYAGAVAVSGKHAYVAAGTYGLRIVDISDPRRPQQVASLDVKAFAHRVVVSDNLVYLATCSPGWATDGLYVVDVSDPRRPSVLAFRESRNGPYRDLAVSNGIAYGATEWGLEVVSLRDPRHPVFLGFLHLWSWIGGPDAVVGVAVSGTRAYLACSQAGLKIVDVSDPTKLTLLGRSSGRFSEALAVADNIAYIADHFGLQLVDVSNPSAPFELGFCPTRGEAYGLAVAGKLVLVADGSRGIAVVDVANPRNPVMAGARSTFGYAYQVAVTQEYVFVADGPGGLVIFGRTAADSPRGLPEARQLLPQAPPSDPLGVSSVPGGEANARTAGVRATVHDADQPATATSSCRVTSVADRGPGSLRACLESAIGGTTIDFDPAVFPPDRPVVIELEDPLPAIRQGRITIDASNAGVILDGRRLRSGNGLRVESDENVVMGLQVLRFPESGIVVMGKRNRIGGDRRQGRGPLGQGNLVSGNREWGIMLNQGADQNVVSGNFVGVDVTGKQAMGNGKLGVHVFSAGNRIGGESPGEGNVISANGENGVGLHGALSHDNRVAGNYIGVDVTGSLGLGNRGHGVGIEVGAYQNRVEKNVISGNGRDGVCMSDSGSSYNIISGNIIGADSSGTKSIPNAANGVFAGWMGASFNLIGGTAPGSGNTISGNPTGVGIYGPAVGILILGNLIGTHVSGQPGPGNRHAGVLLASGSRSIVGGASAAESNTIVNSRMGVQAHSDANVILGNRIGVARDGVTAAGHTDVGVDVQGAGNIVQGNTIANNLHSGVKITGYSGNILRRNQIYNHPKGKGIALENGGNDMLAPPVIGAATRFAVRGAACPRCEVEVFSGGRGEGRRFEGSAVADDAGRFAFETSVPIAGPEITATATDFRRGSSEFSSPISPVPSAAPLASLSAASYAGDVLAPGSIVAAFGSRLAEGERRADLPLPDSLGGVSVKVLDSTRTERPARLYFVSHSQVNFVLPEETASGWATIYLTSALGEVHACPVEIAPVAPGVFTASGTGRGLPAGNLLRIGDEGSQSYESLERPIDLGAETDRVYLLLYGTGIRGRRSLEAVRVHVGGVPAPVTYAGPQPEFPGLDQVNVLLPRQLRGRAEVEVSLVVDGRAANSVLVFVR